jgi:hypothetical protein
MNGKRVGLYLRVSTGEQTVDNQRHALTAACAARGWHIVEEFCDSGISGAKGRDKRPQFDRVHRWRAIRSRQSELNSPKARALLKQRGYVGPVCRLSSGLNRK